MKKYVQITVKTKSNTTDWEVGERLVDSLEMGDGLLIPEQVSYYNPDKFKDPFMGKAACKDIWAVKGIIRSGNSTPREFACDFAWRRKKALKCKGYVVHTMKNIYLKTVPGRINFHSACSEKVDWYSLFKTWCGIFPPQLGMLHIFSEPELEFKVAGSDSFQIGSFNAALKPDVPNAAWAMVYGDEFAEKVDAERIAAAGFPIEKIGNAWLVRVTENIQDVLDDFPRFSKRRAELKSLFPENFFLIKKEPVIGALE
ncbi:MAG: hypothetical protein LBB55_05645 [Zoogloeaceae bacterium]|jgi:hypothetical protein|nr:hypothetical protein [Zoogloeaceae bacterium]